MMEAASAEARAIMRECLQRTIDDLHFYADEMEMGRLPAKEGADAIRLAAIIIGLTRQLT